MTKFKNTHFLVFSKIKITDGQGYCLGGSAGSNVVSTLNATQYMMYNVPLAKVECYDNWAKDIIVCASNKWICYVRLNKHLHFVLIWLILCLFLISVRHGVKQDIVVVLMFIVEIIMVFNLVRALMSNLISATTMVPLPNTTQRVKRAGVQWMARPPNRHALPDTGNASWVFNFNFHLSVISIFN